MTALTPRSLDSFHSRKILKAGGKDYEYFSLPDAEANGLPGIAALPYSLKVLLENLLRFEDGVTVTADDIRAMSLWLMTKSSTREIAFRPARVLMQDFTGVPAVVDLAAMRDAMKGLHGDTAKINPLVPVDLVIDHSVMVDSFGNPRSFEINVDLEYQRNKERYEFLRWGSRAFANFQVVPPGTGICHQVNLEYLAQTVWTKEEGGVTQAFPDTLVGTDSHTTMVNALSVLGWGVGGIEAEAAMLGQPISMLIPEVVGFRFNGSLPEGVTATDFVLTVTQMLRKKGVVGKFVEYFGHGLDTLSVEDRATMANMAPEYGATCGFFPVDKDTINYLSATGRDPHRVALAEAYARAQGLWRDAGTPDPVFTSTLELDLSTVEPSLAGPRRPQDRVPLVRASEGFLDALAEMRNVTPGGDAARMVSEGGGSVEPLERSGPVEGESYSIADGHVVIAAITSCTNTSNPSVLMAAGLLARKALEKGLTRKPWVKTSLAPGSQVVTDYLNAVGPAAGPRRAGVRARRLWLHDMHRQLGAIARADLENGERSRSCRGRRAVGQPEFRRPGQSRCARELSRLAAACRRLCACWHDEARPNKRAARDRQRRRARLLARHMAGVRRGRGVHPHLRYRRYVQGALCRCLQGRRALAGGRRLENRPDL